MDAIAIKKAGSTIVEKQASREAPMPSKLLPVSNALKSEKNLLNTKIYANITNENCKLIIDCPERICTNKDSNITDASANIGVILKTQDVVLLYTESFFNNLVKSQKGCNMQTPLRPDQNAFVFFIIPIIKKGTIKSIIMFINVTNILNLQKQLN